MDPLLPGAVLGPEGPEEGEPGPGGPAPSGHRVCRQRGSIGPHPELQEEPKLQLPGQVVRGGTCCTPLSPAGRSGLTPTVC